MVKISTNYNYEEIIHKFVVLSIARLDKYQFACRNGNKSNQKCEKVLFKTNLSVSHYLWYSSVDETNYDFKNENNVRFKLFYLWLNK